MTILKHILELRGHILRCHKSIYVRDVYVETPCQSMTQGKQKPSWVWWVGKGYTTLWPQLMLTQVELTPTGWEGLKTRPLLEDAPVHNVLPTRDVNAKDSCSAWDTDTGCAGNFLSVASRLQHTPYSTFQGLSKPLWSQTLGTASHWQRSRIAFGYRQRETREKHPSRLIREHSGSFSVA